MSIEQLIADNTAALKENTAVLREVLAASAATTPVAATTPAPAPAKTGKKAAKLDVVETPAPEPVVEETPAPAAEETPEAEPEAPVVEETTAPESTEPVNRDETILEISQEVKGWLGRSGAKMAENMAKYTELRAKWGIQKVTDLEDDKLMPFSNDIKKMIGA
jgi:hypothetical protein